MAAPKISVYFQPGSVVSTSLTTTSGKASEATLVTGGTRFNFTNPYSFGTMEHVEHAATTVELSRVLKLWIFNNGTAATVNDADVTQMVSRLRDVRMYAISYEIFADGVRKNYGTGDGSAYFATVRSSTSNPSSTGISSSDATQRIIDPGPLASNDTSSSRESQTGEAILYQHWVKCLYGHIQNSGSFQFSSNSNAIHSSVSLEYTNQTSWTNISSRLWMNIKNNSECADPASYTQIASLGFTTNTLFGEGHSSLRCAKTTLAIVPPTNADPGTYKFLLKLTGYYT